MGGMGGMGGYGGQSMGGYGQGNPWARFGGTNPMQRTGGNMFQTATSGVHGSSSIPPWANQNQAGSQYNTDPNTQRRIVDPFVDYTQSPVTQAGPSVMSKPLDIGPTQGVDSQFNTDPSTQRMMAMQSTPFNRGSLLRPDAMMDPALMQSMEKAGGQPRPPIGYDPGPRPTGPMQLGQSDWQLNLGSASNVVPNGWVAGFTPGYQQYRASNMAGMTPAQLAQIDMNNQIDSIGRITGNYYNPAIYGQR